MTGDRPEEVSGDVRFVDASVPRVHPGDYTLVARQHVAAGGGRSVYSSELRFSFTDPIAHFAATDVHAVHPPAGAEGDFRGDLPHVVLERATLPWEGADPEAEPDARMAVLLFEVTDLPEIRPGPPTPDGSTDPARSSIVLRGDHRGLLPTADERDWLAHVREVATGGNRSGRATVVGSRPVLAGAQWEAHLVWIGAGPDPDDAVEVTSLYRWRFSSSAGRPDFAGLVRQLDPGTDGSMRRPPPAELPDAAQHLYEHGYVLLPHRLRTGDRTMSWYRGPLAPLGTRAAPLPRPARHADELLRFHAGTGCFDAGPATAWQLGRMTALADERFATDLVRWKRARRHALAARSHELPPVPDPVADRLRRLELLEGVPFDHLVPDEGLLPVESMRWFSLDRAWISALVDGAFSLGRVLRSDVLADEGAAEEAFRPTPTVGVLVRSEVVHSYPGLLVDAWMAEGPAGEIDYRAVDLGGHRRLRPVRTARLGPAILLCLFQSDTGDTELDVIDLHLRPDTLHFGVDGERGAWTKPFRDPTTAELTELPGRPHGIDVAPRHVGPAVTIDVAGLRDDYARLYTDRGEPFHAGDFALQLIRSPALIRFRREGR